MSVQRQPFVTPEEYLARERQAETKSEYYAGEIFAMSGTSKEHDRIAGDLYTALNMGLRNAGCEPFTSDMRVKVSKTGLYTYPDVTVVCGEAQFEDAEVDTLLNPVVLVEVLSATTEAYDRGRKFEQYQTIESLQEYILVAQDRPHVDRFRRQGQDWVLTGLHGLDAVLELEAVQCRVPLSEIYRRVTFENSAATPAPTPSDTPGRE